MTKENDFIQNGLTGMTPEELAACLEAPLMRGRQLFKWFHKKRRFEAEAMTDIPEILRQTLALRQDLTSLTVLAHQRSQAGDAVKLLFGLTDGDTVESVLLRHGDHHTYCLSSQVGCALGCSFCATGLAGYRRNLSCAEIAEQALRLAQESDLPEETTPNIVVMGMGEPFMNYDAVIAAIRLLMHPSGMHIGARKITVSTVGDVKGIERFAAESWQVRLSISLHAAENDLRSKLAPINKRYPLEVLHRTLHAYQRVTGRQITIEYTLLNNVNDAPEQAVQLAAYLRGLDAVVNLIPWNPVPGLPFASSSPARRLRFQEALSKTGIKATLRKERGSDIDAACGQLRNIHRGQ